MLYSNLGRQWEAGQPFRRKPPGSTCSLDRAVSPNRSEDCTELSREKTTATIQTAAKQVAPEESKHNLMPLKTLSVTKNLPSPAIVSLSGYV